MNSQEYKELDELREQIALLKDKLQHQQIVSERAIQQAAQAGIGKLNRQGVIMTAFALFAVVYCSWAFHRFGFSDGFVVGTTIFLGVCALVTAYAHLKLRSIDVASGNLVEIASRLVSFRKIYSHWHIFAIPALLVWCYFLYWDAQRMLDNHEGFLIAGCVGGVIGGIFGLKKHFAIMRETDKVLANIRDLMQNK